MFSRNSESSRALPTELQIERVMNHPYIPEFRERVKGMGGGQPLQGARRTKAQGLWLAQRDAAVKSAQGLLTVAKDDANRLLEPFAWHTAVVTATEWDNFFALRDHEAAAVPMQRLAAKMREAMMLSEPRSLRPGEWHLPFVECNLSHMVAGSKQMDDAPEGVPYIAAVSAGRAARSSYSLHNDPESTNASAGRWGRLSGMGHWSPGEHVAQCVRDGAEFIGNFRGWKQLRKFYDGEAVFNG